MFAVIRMELSGKTVYGPVLKTTQLSEHAQNHASPERCRKSFTLIFLGDHDIPLTGSNFGSVEPWSMARWKALAEFLLSVIELLFLSLTVDALQGKTCQNSQPSGVGR